MKQKLLLSLLLIVLLTQSLFALKVPTVNRRVTDLHGLLNSQEEDRIERVLYNFEQNTSNQIAVLIISSLKGESIEQYSIDVVDKWQLGDKKKENGALLLIAVNDRKVRIEVGYGLEGALTDMITGSIIRNDITPAFRSNNFYSGISKAVNSIILATKNEYKAPARGRKSSRDQGGSFGSIIFFILFILFGVLGGRRGRRRGNGLFWLLLGSNMFRSSGGSSGFGGGGFGGGSGFGGFSGGGGGFGGGGASGGW